jgi:streptogramin lyase
LKTSLFIAVILVSAALADQGDVISQIPAPGGNPDGLTWIDGNLWITSDDEYEIYEINPANGAVITTIPGYGNDASLTGLAYDGTYLLSTCHPMIYFRETDDGAVVDSIPAPGATANEGLTWDGASLWSTNYNDNLVYEIDPETGDLLSYFFPQAADYDGLTGLTYDGFFLWITDQNSQLILKCVPGQPIPWEFFMAPCETPQDLAWDGTTLWVTEYKATGARVYQVDPGPGALTQATWAGIKAEF